MEKAEAAYVERAGQFVARERITVSSGMGYQHAAEHSKWSLLIMMWADGG